MISIAVFFVFFFFFKQKTAYEMRISDWSSDVCSSDLGSLPERNRRRGCRDGAVPVRWRSPRRYDRRRGRRLGADRAESAAGHAEHGALWRLGPTDRVTEACSGHSIAQDVSFTPRAIPSRAAAKNGRESGR